jgi:hypothetical protein
MLISAHRYDPAESRCKVVETNVARDRSQVMKFYRLAKKPGSNPWIAILFRSAGNASASSTRTVMVVLHCSTPVHEVVALTRASLAAIKAVHTKTVTISWRCKIRLFERKLECLFSFQSRLLVRRTCCFLERYMPALSA